MVDFQPEANSDSQVDNDDTSSCFSACSSGIFDSVRVTMCLPNGHTLRYDETKISTNNNKRMKRHKCCICLKNARKAIREEGKKLSVKNTHHFCVECKKPFCITHAFSEHRK